MQFLTNLAHRPGRWMALLLLTLTLILMGRAALPPPDAVLGGHDVRGAFYPWFTFARQAVRAGHLPLWEPYQFAGTPYLSNPQAAFFYPVTWLSFILPVNLAIGLYAVAAVWLAGVGMLLLGHFLTRSWPAALIAALAFCFNGFVAARLWAGHITLIATYAWTPWLLWAAAWSTYRKTRASAILAGVPFGLAALAGHPTSLIYVGLLWLAFTIYLGWSGKAWRWVTYQFALSLLAGLMLCAVQMIPFLELIKASEHAAGQLADGSFQWSMPPSQWIALILPHYYGEPVRVGYWGADNFEELTYYTGTLVVPGLILALHKPTRLTAFCLGLIALGLLIALGSYGFLYPILYAAIPPFRAARAPGRAAFVTLFGVCLLLSDALSTWATAPLDDIRPMLRRAGRWVIVLLIVGSGVPAGMLILASHIQGEAASRLLYQARSWAWGLGVLGASSVLIGAYLMTQPTRPWRRRALAAGLSILLIADLWSSGQRLIQLQPIPPTPIWQDALPAVGRDSGRILLWLGEGTQPYDINSASLVEKRTVMGYNPIRVKAIADFIVGSPDPRSAAYDVLGVEYVVAGAPLGFTEGEHPLVLIEHNGSAWVYRRDRVLDLARLVYSVEVIPSPSTAIARVNDPDFDPATTAILSAPPPCEIGPRTSTPNGAEIVEARDGYWRIETRSASPALLVLSETIYPGWRVTVDGQPAAILTAYAAVRATCVPAGEHTVEWVYRPSIYWIGGVVSLLALVGMIAAAVVVWQQKDGKQGTDNQYAGRG